MTWLIKICTDISLSFLSVNISKAQSNSSFLYSVGPALLGPGQGVLKTQTDFNKAGKRSQYRGTAIEICGLSEPFVNPIIATCVIENVQNSLQYKRLKVLKLF